MAKIGKPKRQRTVCVLLRDRESGWCLVTQFTVFRSGRVAGEPRSDFPTPEVAARLDVRRDRLAALLHARWFGDAA